MNASMKKIYLDHAATTPLDKEVLNAMLPYLTDVFGNADSPHGFGRAAMCAVDDARDTLAALLNAAPSEIYFTSGGTESDNWAMFGGAYAMKKKGKEHVILSAVEHHAVLAAAEKLAWEGFNVSYLLPDSAGKILPEALRAALTEQTGLVAVMAANNETGTVQPVKELAAIAHENGSLFFCDGVQAAPYLPIDVKAWGIDMLSISAHKFYGPKGAGALYVKSGVSLERLIVGGEQERGMRGGTTATASVAGLAAAYRKNVEGRDGNNEKMTALKTRFFAELTARTDGIEKNGKDDLPAILNLRIRGVENTAFLYNMDLVGIALSAGAACSSSSVKPSHVLTALGLDERAAKESVRFSFGKNNTEEEVVFAAEKAAEAIARIRALEKR